MKRKLMGMILVVILILTTTQVAFAQTEKHQLKFDENGEFKIMHICDIQDKYPLNLSCAQYIKEILAEYKPDLVVLGGDNTVADIEDKEEAIKEICELFTESNTYFTLGFGNHDAEKNMSREEQFEFYRLYGGEYCLAYDADENLTGVGNHNLTVLSSDETYVAYNLYMFDSNMYVYDEDGNKLGYDCVHQDQIDWYKETSERLKAENGGKNVPALAFQHIVPQEANEVLFVQSPIPLGDLGKDCAETSYTFLPMFWNIKEGLMLEMPTSGYYNLGQFDAMVETGDVQAIFCGHDHINSYVIEKDGVEIINTPSCTFRSYSDDTNRGCRLITLNENDPENYKTEIIGIGEQALKENSQILSFGDMTVHQARASVVRAYIGDLVIKITHYVYEEIIPAISQIIGGNSVFR